MKSRTSFVLLIPLAAARIGLAQEAPPAKKTISSFAAAGANVAIPTKPVVTYKAFQPQEFSKHDANGNKVPIKPGETITLKNGKSVKIEDYISSTNELEKRLNKLGYSLRTKTALPQPQSQIDKLKQAQADLDKLTAGSPSSPPTVMLDGVPYDRAMANIQSANPGVAAPAGKSSRSTLNASNPPDALLAKGDHQMKVSGGKTGNWGSTVDGFGYYFKCALSLDGSAEVNNSQYAQSLSEFNATASADAGAVLFGQNIDVLHADAAYSGSDKTGNVHIAAHLGVLGSTVWQDDLTQAVGYSDGHTWSQTFDESAPAVTIPCSICSIGVQAGITGSAGITCGYKLFTSRVEGNIMPFIECQAYFRAGGGIDLGIASAEIGIQGSLVIINDRLNVTCNAGVYYDNGFRFKDSLDVTNAMNALSGNVSVYASASFLFFSDSVTIPLFSWGGLNFNSTLYHYQQDVPLPWH